MAKKIIEKVIPIEDDSYICRGLFFRGYRSQWTDHNRDQRYCVRQDVQLRLLKKKSCKGCAQCGSFWEHVRYADSDSFDLSQIEKGKIYMPVFQGWGRNQKSGEIEGTYVFAEVTDLF